MLQLVLSVVNMGMFSTTRAIAAAAAAPAASEIATKGFMSVRERGVGEDPRIDRNIRITR